MTPTGVSHPREQYLRKDEARIRSVAAGLIASGTPDPAIAAELEDIIATEDMFDLHQVTANFHQERRVEFRAKIHRRHAAQCARLKLRALDRLAHLVL
jgi:hypothetical protein